MESPLPTLSIPDRDSGPSGALPLTFDRVFRPWRYAVSHSELRLRTVDTEAGDLIEAAFFGVVGMKLKSLYQSLTIDYADRAQTAEILRFADIKEKSAHHVRCLTLHSTGDSGFIACLSFVVRSYPPGRGPDRTDNSALIARSNR